MFKSIKEKLILIKNSSENKSYSLIAEYLLDCMETNKTPKSIEAAEKAFCSESVVTSFAKKNGYEGFRELAIRVKVETEYYDFNNIHVDSNGAIAKSNYREIVDQSFNMIDLQEDTIMRALKMINEAKNIYIVSSYQQLNNTELFASELQLLGYNAHFNMTRKSNAAWVSRCTEDDLAIVVAFGLDNQYVENYYDLLKGKTKNILLISSSSQIHKFDGYKEAILADYSSRVTILESSRATIINYLFSSMIFKLGK
ncbi:MurR/RpiR family transcriptional regulator [[Acholeplasma] multilocale]|uniref:MurR/RpiR family transcriptional regulator n=1 Tax=[Acholeplasma] multilocale TaxID=264638 RepID=UPI000479444A|nr:MurR/RpiR family transcriptional regulator [[Acholeplasma] multilocale]